MAGGRGGGDRRLSPAPEGNTPGSAEGGGDGDFESPLLSGYLDLWRGKRDWAHFCPVYFLLGGCRWVGGEGGGVRGGSLRFCILLIGKSSETRD